MKSYRKSLIVCAAVCAVAAVTMAATLQRGGRQQRAEYTPPEEATPIKEGVKTEKQKEHGKIYKGYAAMVGHRKIKDLIAAQPTGDVDIWTSIDCPQVMPPIELATYLQRITCGADAVVYGRVKSQSSQLDESGSFLFTDYEVTLGEVLKADAPLSQGQDITVVRGGGAVILNNRLVRAINPNNGRLKVGEHYLFYLKGVGATGGYRPFSNMIAEDTFRLDKDTISQISHKQWPFGQSGKVDAALFLNEARVAAAAPCEQVRAFK